MKAKSKSGTNTNAQNTLGNILLSPTFAEVRARLFSRPTTPPPNYGPIAQKIHQSIMENEGFGDWLLMAAEGDFPGPEFPKDEEIFKRLLNVSSQRGAMAFLLICCHDDILPEFRIMDWKRFGPISGRGTADGCLMYVYGRGAGPKLDLYLMELLAEFQKRTGGQGQIKSAEGMHRKPPDIIPLNKAVELFWVSRTQLKRDIKDGVLKDYKEPGKKIHLVSESEVEHCGHGRKQLK